MRSVTYLAPRGLDRTIAYQRYYLLGLEERARTRWHGPPLTARVVPGLDAKVRLLYHLHRDRERMLNAMRRAIGRSAVAAKPGVEGHVGRYLAELDGETVRFAIDAHDSRHVRDEDALRWSDVYFKSNRWPDEIYDEKVLPLVNGNGLLDRRRIARLRALRDHGRDTDVAFISNFRPGRPHMLRLFEELARLPIRCDLLAVFDGLHADDDARYIRQLKAAGIPCSLRPLPPEELWARLARAKVVLLRGGRHTCLPWRTVDLLCMGACIVLDADPAPEWPIPLRSGHEYAGCGMQRPPDDRAADGDEYEKLAVTVMRLLAQQDEAERLRDGAARYFDTHAAPGRVAEYILRECSGGCRTPRSRTE
jgi:hypothetical protein